MKRVAIIGLGTISEKYLEVLNKCNDIKVIAHCDLVKMPLTDKGFSIGEYYKDYHAIPLNKLDYVFILTPPNTHFKIAEYFLKNEVNVLVEKPGTNNLDELETLIKIARKNQLIFDVILHWRYGEEVKDVNRYFLNVKSIYMKVRDPYYDGEIIPDKRSLDGAWMDSGINVLSLLVKHIDLSKIEIIKVDSLVDSASGLDYKTLVELKKDECKIIIDIEWTKSENFKATYLKLPDKEVEINHSLQSVIVNEKLVLDMNFHDRLETHYQNFFKSLDDYKTDYEELVLLHKILFEIKEEIS